MGSMVMSRMTLRSSSNILLMTVCVFYGWFVILDTVMLTFDVSIGTNLSGNWKILR